MAIVIGFTVYDRTGAPLNVQVTGNHAAETKADLDEILALGFALTPPPLGQEPRIERIIGYVKGEANDKQAGRYMPCVYLYNDKEQLEFATATVYHERLEELPFAGALDKVPSWNGAAPKRAEARIRKFMQPCNFTIELVPEIDYATGEVKRSTKGNPLYKYSRVLLEPATETQDVDFYQAEDQPEQKPHKTFAALYSDPDVKFTEPEGKIIERIRDLDGQSTKRIEVKNYQDLMRAMDQIAGKDWGNPLLECILGRAVNRKATPGVKTITLLSWLEDAQRGQAVRDALEGIAAKCKKMASDQWEGEPLFE